MGILARGGIVYFRDLNRHTSIFLFNRILVTFDKKEYFTHYEPDKFSLLWYISYDEPKNSN